MISILGLLGLTLLAIVSFGLIFYVAIPLRRMSFYKGEGRVTFFYPVFGFYKQWADDAKYKGDIIAGPKEFGLYTPENKILISNIQDKAVVFLRDPAYIKECLQKYQYYKKASFGRTLLPLVGTGLVLAEGDMWKHHRKIVSNSFHYEFLKTNIPAIQRITKEFLGKITPDDYKGYSAIPRVEDITGEVVGRIFFGENLTKYTFEGKPLTLGLATLVSDLGLCARSHLVLFLGPNVMKAPIFPRFVKMMKRIKEFRSICTSIIADKKTHLTQDNDLLTSLLTTQESEDASERFSDEDIINEFITFFVAGMDTTGHLIGMTLYNLARHPQYLQQLKEERDRTFNQEKTVTAEALQKMDVLHAMLKETMRLHTPATGLFARVAIQDHKLLDLDIRKGDRVRPDFFSIFYNEKNFEGPTQFKPERWLTAKSNLDPYAFTPFSAGPRNCIGQHLAVLEAKIIVSEFLERFEFRLPENYKLKMTIRLAYGPVDDLRLTLTPKKEQESTC